MHEARHRGRRTSLQKRPRLPKGSIEPSFNYRYRSVNYPIVGAVVRVSLKWIVLSCLGLSLGTAVAQESGRRRDQPRIPPALLAGSERPANCGHALRVDASQSAEDFEGSFGLDLSHYTFDIKNSDTKCSSADGYEDPACSCTVDWTQIKNHGLRYVYSKASDGRGSDLSFRRVWSELEYHHRTKKIFRGAYHFLRPTVDADVQADTFLRAIGAVDGKKPLQLPPVLDIEWSNKRVLPGTVEFMRCPASKAGTE